MEEGSQPPFPSLDLCTGQARNQQQYERCVSYAPIHKIVRWGTGSNWLRKRRAPDCSERPQQLREERPCPNCIAGEVDAQHCDESEWAVPGPSPDVSDQTFPGPEYDLLLWAEKNPLPCRPEFSRNFCKLVCCTCSQAGIFLEILLPQPGTFKKVRCTCSQTGVFREYSLSQPKTISKFIAFPRKKNCQHHDLIHHPSDYQADVLPPHHQI